MAAVASLGGGIKQEQLYSYRHSSQIWHPDKMALCIFLPVMKFNMWLWFSALLTIAMRSTHRVFCG